jgi:putative ubiquitin-RnfH superfamily antitoxin RatB of RatAB toxin-antitoxin module
MWIEMVRRQGEREWRRMLTLPPGVPLREALRVAGLERFFERWLGAGGGVSVNGRRVHLETVLRPADRVEFLKPLKVGPGDLQRGWLKKRKRY